MQRKWFCSLYPAAETVGLSCADRLIVRMMIRRRRRAPDFYLPFPPILPRKIGEEAGGSGYAVLRGAYGTARNGMQRASDDVISNRIRGDDKKICYEETQKNEEIHRIASGSRHGVRARRLRQQERDRSR